MKIYLDKHDGGYTGIIEFLDKDGVRTREKEKTKYSNPRTAARRVLAQAMAKLETPISEGRVVVLADDRPDGDE